jgi:hypothetical protein
MSSLLVFHRVYRLDIQSVMLVFSTPLVNCCVSTFSLTTPTPPPSQSERTYSIYGTDRVWLWRVGGVLSCVVDHILQEFNTLFLTRFRTYKIATPSQTKTPVKTTFRVWCLYNCFVQGVPILNVYLGAVPKTSSTALDPQLVCRCSICSLVQVMDHFLRFTTNSWVEA